WKPSTNSKCRTCQSPSPWTQPAKASTTPARWCGARKSPNGKWNRHKPARLPTRKKPRDQQVARLSCFLFTKLSFRRGIFNPPAPPVRFTGRVSGDFWTKEGLIGACSHRLLKDKAAFPERTGTAALKTKGSAEGQRPFAKTKNLLLVALVLRRAFALLESCSGIKKPRLLRGAAGIVAMW